MADVNAIHEEILFGISSTDWQKSQGFITYDITRAMAFAVASLSDDITEAESRFIIDNLSGDDLTAFVYEHRGLSRKEGTPAYATLKLLSGSGNISKGDLFSTATGETFEATADCAVAVGDTWQVKSIGNGVRYNVEADTIVKYPLTIEGILEFTNPAAADGGSDIESDEAIIERYKDDLLYPNNGSNKQAYISWAESVAGVGRVKVFSQPNNVANSVEVCITDTEMTAADTSTIQAVQAFIDPNANGDGSGTAPIGAKCTVTSASEKAISVSVSVTLATGAVLATVKSKIETMLSDYFKEIAFKRLDTDSYQTVVSITQIGSRILAIPGVTDYSGLKLNSSASSVTLTDRQIPVSGTVTVTGV